MIPYVQFDFFSRLGLPFLQLFGVLVALGVIIGDRVTVRQGAKRGLDPRDVRFLNARMVIGGFVMAHLVSVVFYFPHRIVESPLILINLWSGLSSFGGFVGAALTYLYFCRKEKIPPLPYADAVALGLAVGWIFGRLGCTTAHDHPGRHSHFFLAVRYPDGARHDLGFYELLFTLVLTVLLFVYARRPRPAGRIIGLFATLYAPVRFGLDFLRAVNDVPHPDARYAGLTPAQWACLLAFGVGVWLLRRPSPTLEFSGPPPPDAGEPVAAPAPASPSTPSPSPSPSPDSARTQPGAGGLRSQEIALGSGNEIVVSAAVVRQIGLAQEGRVAHEGGQVRQIARPCRNVARFGDEPLTHQPAKQGNV
jgi:phosphatidylglycerol---prolipoprotein diacylglyceryl transferase